MRLWFKDLIEFFKSKKKFFSTFLNIFLILVLFISFFYSLSRTNNLILVPSCQFEENIQYEATTNVGTFITDGEEPNEDEIIKFFNELFTTRNKAFLTGNVADLYKFYDTSHTYSKYSLLHEFKRIAYLRDWANERNISFSNISSTPKIRDIKINNSTYSIVLREEYKFDYFYKDTPDINNEFGVSLLHNVDLKKMGNSFIVQKDYYLDCFQEGLKDYKFDLTEKQIPLTKFKAYNVNFNRNNLEFNTNKFYDRKAAVNYANKYCGISWANDNNSRYNNNYYVYTASCGNCTNFISQCLSDKNEGGKLKQDKIWLYETKHSKPPTASETWINSDKLINYLLSTKRSTLINSGNFENLMSNFNNLQHGDLISYNINNSIEHTAIVTDFDNKGYPLVNSNSIDKYKFPFDLGWSNDDITFNLLSIIE